MTPSGQVETVAFLTRLAAAPPIETHISFVFMGAETVWKLKKAVRLSFLDFSDLAARHHFCQRELALNAPAAPGLYRDVAAVVRRADGALALDEAGEPIDWVVRMARIPAEDFLEVRAAAGLSPTLLDAIGDGVAAWHRALAPLPGIRPDLAWVADENARAALAAGLPDREVAAWREAATVRLAALSAWCEARAAAGFVRRCHGDLHLGNLCLWRGVPVPFDALEFDERLASIDVAYDLAFLLMDLDHRLDRSAANRVMNRYVARNGDADLVRGLPVFLSLRAMVRAHVEARSGHPLPAASYLRSAANYLTPRPPVLIAIGGLPGSGKSTLARALAPSLGVAPGALVARSDEIRKRLAGTVPEQRLPPEAYTPERSAAVFAELARLAEVAASGGHAVIADATFMDRRHREMIEAAAGTAGVPFVGLWLIAPREDLEQRVTAREGDASDATVAVVRSASAHDPGPGTWHPVDARDRAFAMTMAKALVRSHIVL
jgi:uncharacterized protein